MQKHLDDIMLLIGYVMIFFGVWQISPPAAWIVGGILAIAGGFIYAKAQQPVRKVSPSPEGQRGPE